MNKTFFNNRKLIIITILLYATTLFNGCYSLAQTEAIDDPTIKIYKIETLKNETISFKKTKFGYGTILGDKIISIKAGGEEEAFPLAKVKKLYTEKLDVDTTVILIFSSLALLGWWASSVTIF